MNNVFKDWNYTPVRPAFYSKGDFILMVDEGCFHLFIRNEFVGTFNNAIEVFKVVPDNFMPRHFHPDNTNTTKDNS